MEKLSEIESKDAVVEDKYESNFNQFLENYIEKLDEILLKFIDLRSVIGSHHYSCNVAKTAGTAVSGAGVAMIVGSVLLAPVTSGSTLAVGAGGAVMSVTGGLSNIITDYVDYRTSTSIMAEIHEIVQSKEKFNENLKLQLDNFALVIDKLMESGMDKDKAIVTAVKGVASGCIDLTEESNTKLVDTLTTLIKLHHIEKAAVETLPIIGKTAHISEKSFQFIYNFFGLTGKTAPHILRTIGQISSVVSVAFTVVDIALLIRDWKTEHPSVEVVAEVEKKIREEKEVLSELLEVLQSSSDNREVVLKKVLEDIEVLEDDEMSEYVIV